jgi:hypothetical protein
MAGHSDAAGRIAGFLVFMLLSVAALAQVMGEQSTGLSERGLTVIACCGALLPAMHRTGFRVITAYVMLQITFAGPVGRGTVLDSSTRTNCRHAAAHAAMSTGAGCLHCSSSQ